MSVSLSCEFREIFNDYFVKHMRTAASVVCSLTVSQYLSSTSQHSMLISILDPVLNIPIVSKRGGEGKKIYGICVDYTLMHRSYWCTVTSHVQINIPTFS